MVATTLSQSILAGMDPSVIRNIQNIENGENYLKTGMDASPTTSYGALGRLANALAGAYIQGSSTSELAKSISEGKKSAADLWMPKTGSLSASVPAAPPALAPTSNPGAAPPPPLAPQAAAPDPNSPNAQVARRFPANMSPGGTSPGALPLENGAPSPLDTAQYPAGPVGAPSQVAASSGPDYGSAISNIESGGKYDLLGPVTKSGDRAFGKYQVMGANVPEWTQAILGKSMTPKEFLANPEAQDAVFKGKFGEYAQKYGPEGAAKAWFAGEHGMKNPNARDQLGTTVQSYADQFTRGLGDQSGPQAIAAAASGAAPVRSAAVAPSVASDADETPAKPGQQVAQNGLGVSQLLQVLHHPYASEEEKALASKLLLQKLTPQEDEFASSPQGIFNKRTGEVKQAQGIAGADFGGLQGKDLLAAVQKTSPAVASQVTAIIEGRAPYPTGSRLNPVQQQVKELVTQVDPTFEQGNSGARIKVRNEFNAGGPNSPAASITAGNTAIQHLGHLSDEAEKLGNADSGVPGNNLYNQAKNALAVSRGGGVPVTNFDSIRNKYIEEATKFYRGTGGNESDLQRDIASLNSAQSPSQLRDVIKTQAGLMQSKINALQERWKHGMGPMVEDFPIIHPESQTALDRINQRQAGKKVDEEKKAEVPATPGSPDRAAIEAELRRRGLLK